MINWGIIGTGFISSVMAKDFKYVTEGKLTAVLGTSDVKAQKFAEKFDIKKSYSDLESFLADDDIDAIYIATPHPTHKAIAIAAMKAKKAVVCEKPMAVNKSDELEMVKVAKEENVFLMEAFWTLYLPAIKQALDWVKEGRIGQLRLIEGDFSFRTDQDESGRLLNPDLAGGALLDVGIYTVGIANYIANMVGAGALVSTSNVAQMTDSGVDGQDCITLQYANGLSAHLTCAVMLDGLKGLILYGEQGRIEVPVFFSAKKATLYADNDRFDFKSDTDASGYSYEINAVNDLLKAKQKTSDIVTLENSLQVMGILDSLRQMINLKYPFE